MPPLGEGNSGGSFYQFSNPEGYVDNAHAEPDRYWFEGELQSILGGVVDPLAVLDYNFAVGKFPVELHNSLLMNDEILGVGLGKNSILVGGLSNLNVQFLYALNDVENAAGDHRLYGVNAAIDHRRTFYELSYLLLQHEDDPRRDARYAAKASKRGMERSFVAIRSFILLNHVTSIAERVRLGRRPLMVMRECSLGTWLSA